MFYVFAKKKKKKLGVYAKEDKLTSSQRGDRHVIEIKVLCD